jgi:pimeloyl-ACP methyl ester carboxylesterase
MPTLRVSGGELSYDDSGGSGPAVVFSHGLLFTRRLFEAQVAHLRGRFRCIAYDHRGQGQSSPGAGRIVTIEQTYDDAVALLEGLKLGPCHFVGLSMGGFVGLRLAARRPDLLRSLVLLETSADEEPRENLRKYKLLVLGSRLLGVRPLVSQVMPIMFGKTFLNDPARAVERQRWRDELAANGPGIFRACNGVIERAGVTGELSRIKVPTLVMVGEEDVATVPAKSERLVAAIPGAKLVRIPRAGHSSTIEEPAVVNRELDSFFG